MSGKEKILVLLIAGVLSITGAGLFQRNVGGPDFVEAPVQNNLIEKSSLLHKGKSGTVTLTLLAEYQINGVVKSTKTYHSDVPAAISPMDVVLAWGNLNQAGIDASVKYSQSGRWYYYKLETSAPVSLAEVQTQSSNTHLIPATGDVLDRLKKIRKHDLVELQGYLVSVVFDPEQPPWSSSMTRTDSGDHACEIMYVTSVDIK